MEETAGGEAGVAAVIAGPGWAMCRCFGEDESIPGECLPAALQLLDETIIDAVTAGGDVQEQVDLLDVVDETVGPGDVSLCGSGS